MNIIKNIIGCTLLAALATGVWGCRPPKANSYDIVPLPAHMVPAEGCFTLRGGQVISVPAGDAQAMKIAGNFAADVHRVSGRKLIVAESAAVPDITFERAAGMGAEGYTLDVTPTGIAVRATEPAGLFYGIKTLMQLLPPEIESRSRTCCVRWRVPCVHIEDSPRFDYRGMMLDVGRYFMPKEYVKEFIDRIASQKINRFHFHLTEDQGWRIEIKGWPRLTEFGAVRPSTMVGYKHYHSPVLYDSVPHSGYFTQDDIREIVAYAADRYVMVIPEIEIPGHSSAAVAAYPELSCGVADSYEVVREFGVFENVYCPNERTFRFLEDVIAQVAGLFPSPYIHVGGDECPKVAWKKCAHCQSLIREHGLKDESGLQSWFIRRVGKIVQAHGKQLIGWDEILEGGDLADNAVVMSWRGEKGGIEAAASGHSVIMVPNADTYLNYYQEDPEYARMGSGSFLNLERVYRYEPIPAKLPADQHKYVLGTEATLWTPYMKTPEAVDYYMYPRFWAIAEVAWSGAERDYQGFLKRLESQYDRLAARGVTEACRNYFDAYIEGRWNADSARFEVSLVGMLPRGEIRYTLDGSDPSKRSALYTGPVPLGGDAHIKAAVFDGGKMAGKVTQKNFWVNKATGCKTWANVGYRFRPDNPGAGDLTRYNFCGLTNGIRGYVKHVHPWVAFQPAEQTLITVDLGKSQEVSHVRFGVLNGYGQEAVAPVGAAIEISADTLNFTRVAARDFKYVIENKWQIFNHEFEFTPVRARYVRLSLTNGHMPGGLGNYPIPAERQDRNGMVFMDEIEIM